MQLLKFHSYVIVLFFSMPRQINMLLVVSPAKNLDYETELPSSLHSMPDLLAHSQELIKECIKLSPADISSLMSISDKLAGLNAARFGEWNIPFTQENARPAVFAFNGDVYTGLDAYSLSQEQLEYAQGHMRILSGLYGLLRPLDLMQAYRLEMGTKLANSRGQNLYKFWGDIITQNLNSVLEEFGHKFLVNLASTEYFKAVKKKNVAAEIITPSFKDWKNGQYKMISFFAKKARGMMARYIIENNVKTIEQLKAFNVDGYEYNDSLSNGNDIVFTRRQD